MISYISYKVCGLGFDCIFVVVIKLLVCFLVVIKTTDLLCVSNSQSGAD